MCCDGHHIGRSQSLTDTPNAHGSLDMRRPCEWLPDYRLVRNSADAQSFAEDYSLKDWWVAEIISPGAFAESPVATASKSHL